MDVQAAVQEAVPLAVLAAIEAAALDEQQQQQQESSGGAAAAQAAVPAAASAQILPAAGDASLEELQQQESSGALASAAAQDAMPAEAWAAVLPVAEDGACHAREVPATLKPVQPLSPLPLELLYPQDEPCLTAVASPMSRAAVAEPATPEPVQALAAASSEPTSPQGEAGPAAAAWPPAQQAAMPEPVQALTAAPAEPQSPPTLEPSLSTAARLLEQQAAVAEPATLEPAQAVPAVSPQELIPRTLGWDSAAASSDSEGLGGAQECILAAADVDAADQQTLDTAVLPPADAAAHAEQQDFREPLLEVADQVLKPVSASSSLAGSGAVSKPGRQATMRSSGSGVVPVAAAAAAEAGSSVEKVQVRPSAAAAAPAGEASVSTKTDFHVVCTLAARLRMERRLAEHAVSQAEEMTDVKPRASDAGRQHLPCSICSSTSEPLSAPLPLLLLFMIRHCCSPVL